MTDSFLDIQSTLPRSIPLFRYVPHRVHCSLAELNPSKVKSPADLPPYLILGALDTGSFNVSGSGWSARWQGSERNTHFDVAYNAPRKQWGVRQTWRGLDGGFSLHPTRVSLDKVIAQALYRQFPRLWDSEAKAQIESEYQMSVVEQPQAASSFCGIPDGAFRSIIFPMSVRNLRPVRDWIHDLTTETPLPYPITFDARLFFQAVNYIEGKAPQWTTQQAVCFKQSVIETGLVPDGLPVREAAKDGSAAWTLRRDVYLVFVCLPFAGLTDFLRRADSENGPIRLATGPRLRFDLRPVVTPAGFELQAESLALWDSARSTRSVLTFASHDQKSRIPTSEQVIRESQTTAVLTQAETTSKKLVAAIEDIFEQDAGRARPSHSLTNIGPGQ